MMRTFFLFLTLCAAKEQCKEECQDLEGEMYDGCMQECYKDKETPRLLGNNKTPKCPKECKDGKMDEKLARCGEKECKKCGFCKDKTPKEPKCPEECKDGNKDDKMARCGEKECKKCGFCTTEVCGVCEEFCDMKKMNKLKAKEWETWEVPKECGKTLNQFKKSCRKCNKKADKPDKSDGDDMPDKSDGEKSDGEKDGKKDRRLEVSDSMLV